MEQHLSLRMDLPRGWYQVAGVTPHTFRRHGLATASGKLQLTILPPRDEPPETGDEALQMLSDTLTQLDMPTGTPLENGHEPCACGLMAHATYRHVGGQREYWIIACCNATVFASWEMGAKATAGLERHDIHEMLKQLYFEAEEEAEEEESASLEQVSTQED